jgi:hypothetical protein
LHKGRGLDIHIFIEFGFGHTTAILNKTVALSNSIGEESEETRNKILYHVDQAIACKETNYTGMYQHYICQTVYVSFRRYFLSMHPMAAWRRTSIKSPRQPAFFVQIPGKPVKQLTLLLLLQPPLSHHFIYLVIPLYDGQ